MTAADLQNQIQGLHALAATLTGNPVLMLQDNEARELAIATHGVLEHYQISLIGPNAVWVRLAVAAGMVYVPRVGALMLQARAKARPPRAAAMATPMPENTGGIDFGGAFNSMQ